MRRLCISFVCAIMVLGVLAESSQAACKGRGRGRNRGGRRVAELRLEREQLLLEQQALLLGAPRLSIGLAL